MRPRSRPLLINDATVCNQSSLLADFVCMLLHIRRTTLNTDPNLSFSKQQNLKPAHFFYMAVLGSHIAEASDTRGVS